VAKKSLLVALILQGAFYYAGMYDLSAARTARAVYERVLRACALGSVLLFLLWYVLPALEVGRGIFLGAVALTALIVPAWRLGYDSIAANEGFQRRALILGNGPLAKELAEMIARRADLGLELVGMLARDRAQVDFRRGVIGTYEHLFDIAMREEVQV